MAKLGKESKAVVAEILKEPITGTFGGKAAEVQAMVDVLEAIGKKAKHISPTMMAKVAWGVIRDGRVIQADVKRKTTKADEDEVEYYSEDELMELKAGELREEAEFFEVKLTKSRGGKTGKITGKARVKLVEAILDQYPEDVLEDDDDDDVPWTRKDLNAMKPKEVLEIAKAWEITVPKNRKDELLKERDYRWIVEVILTVQEGGDVEDVSAELYTKKELAGFDVDELEELADDWELELKGKKRTKKKLISAILKFQREELE